MTFKVPCLLLLGLASLTSLAQSDVSHSNRKALVIGRGDPLREQNGDALHPQSAKNNFLKYVGNPANDPAMGWTCDLSWDLMEQLGMDPNTTRLEDLFAYIGKHKLGYRIAMRNLAFTANDPFWAAAVENGIMPFAAHGNNDPNKRVERPPGLQPCVAVAGGRSRSENTYGPSLEFFEAAPLGFGGILGEDTAQSWANQMVAAKFAKILDRHPKYNIWDARQHLRQAASFWDDGWTERNGYGRINLNARVSKLQPAPPLEFRATLARNGRQVHFSWRNFPMTDFAATVIARKDGRILYEGAGTNFVWTTDLDVPEAFVYGSRNRAGEKSRLESYQTRSVPGLSYRGKPSCLVLAEAGENPPVATGMLAVFQAAATNWVSDMACRPGSQQAQWAGLFPGSSQYAAVLPDFAGMVDYAISNRYQLVLVPTDELAAQSLDVQAALWDRALAAGVTVVTAHSGVWPESEAQAHRPSPARLGSAITVAYADGTNAYTHGPGLEFMDAAASPPNYVGAYAYDANAAAATVAARLARILELHPDYNGFDARQLLRQSSSLYSMGWREKGGYGQPPVQAPDAGTLDLAPPLEIQAQKSSDGKTVKLSWLNFRQSEFAATVIELAEGGTIYEGQGSSHVWRSDRAGEAIFKFHTRGKNGALSRDEPYTVIRIGGLQVR